MNLLMTLYVAALFVLLTPGVLVKLPPKGSLLTVAIVHGLVFALIYHLSHRTVYRLVVDGFEDSPMNEDMPVKEEKKEKFMMKY
jgi:hypothetical protein